MVSSQDTLMLLDCDAGEDFCPLDCKDMKPVNPQGNHPWLFTGRTDTEAEAPILWPWDSKNQLIGKDWRWEKGATGDKMVGGITDSMDMNLSKLQEIVEDREACHAEVHGVAKSWTWLSDWTTTASFKNILPATAGYCSSGCWFSGAGVGPKIMPF